MGNGSISPRQMQLCVGVEGCCGSCVHVMKQARRHDVRYGPERVDFGFQCVVDCDRGMHEQRPVAEANHHHSRPELKAIETLRGGCEPYSVGELLEHGRSLGASSWTTNPRRTILLGSASPASTEPARSGYLPACTLGGTHAQVAMHHL